MRMTREERKLRNTKRARNAANKRWEQEHAAIAAAGVVIEYDQHHAYGDYEITVKSIRSGKVNTIYLHEGKRRDNFFADLNGK